MDQPPPKPFQLLSNREFQALTTEGRIAYLKQAMEIRNSINRLIDAAVTDTLPPFRKKG